jgi:predicted dehydrogenase/threonine dehydrogenase-like Zn-dependent dehydrogenase
MKQVLQNMRDGKTIVVEVPAPTARPGQALVRVAASLVSAGTERMLVEFGEKSLVGKARARPDLVRQVVDKMKREGAIPTVKAAINRLDQPIALGYSSAGTIVMLGGGMEGFKVGQRVACSGGGYAVHAEYNVVPRNLLTALPAGVDFESAAFTTLGAIALHGFRLAQPQIGESVAVLGLGLLGCLAGQIAAAAGCRVFGIDTKPERVKLAASLGLTACLRNQAVEAGQAFTSSHGFDVVLICADTGSNDPVELAGALARDRGRVVATGAVGLSLPRKVYYEKEISFINSRSYGPGRYDPSYEENGIDYPGGYVRWTEGRNFQAVVELMAEAKLKVAPLISHRFPIEKAADAYQVITGKKKQEFLGVLLTYSAEDSNVPMTRVTFPSTRSSGKAEAVKLGVIGAGLYANATLLPVLQKVDGLELVGIASAGGLHAQSAAKKFGFAYAASNDDEILNDPSINTIAILTRHDTHAGLAVRALQAGKHVFVEKPLAIDASGLEKVVASLSNTGGKKTKTRGPAAPLPGLLTVGFNRRFAPLAVKLSEFLAKRSEPLHAHYRVNAGFLPPTHWTQDPAQGGGRVIGEACHFVDFLTFLAGAAPVSVSAQSLPDAGKYRGDNLSMTFTFPDGSIGVLDYLANGDKSFPKERLEIFCGGEVAVLDDFRSLETVRDGKRSVAKMTQDKGWAGEWAAFVNAIRGGGEAPIPYEQLIGVTRATFAAVESLQAGGALIKISTESKLVV